VQSKVSVCKYRWYYFTLYSYIRKSCAQFSLGAFCVSGVNLETKDITEIIWRIPLEKLRPYPDHPFAIRDDMILRSLDALDIRMSNNYAMKVFHHLVV
jgi:hypothetical protein